MTDHHECNNGSSIASLTCSYELDRSNASNIETATSKHIVEDDAGSCFMPPNALTERIVEQPPRSLLNNLTYHELLMFTLRTQVLRWSLISSCAVERTSNEGCKRRDKWRSSFAPRSVEQDASRATGAKNTHPEQYNERRNGMGTLRLLPQAAAVAALKHASARPRSLQLASTANAHSQQIRMEEHTDCKATTELTAATTMKYTTPHGSASGLPAPGGEPLASIIATSTSPRCTSKAEYAPPHEQEHLLSLIHI